MTPELLAWLTLAVFLIALLYSSVGHAGASGYLAVMALFSVAPEVIRPTALMLNILVASIASWQFWRAGHLSWPLFWPFALLAARLQTFRDEGMGFVATVGGTGLGPRDRTVEVVRDLLTTEVPGLMEAARSFGQARTPFAMLSRGIAGFAGNTLIATFPGSRRGAEETLAALQPGLIHLVDVFRGARHRGGYGQSESAA